MKKIISLMLSIVMLTSITVGLDFSAKAEQNPTDIVDISAGGYISAAVRADGSLWTWGQELGGLCVGSTRYGTPRMVLSNSVSSVIQGGSDTVILRNDHTLWRFYSGRKPYKVLDDVVAYDTSGSHYAAVKNDGSLYVWGDNTYGQVGNGTTESVSSPTKIDLDNVTSVSLGERHSAAVTSDGSLYMWGYNYHGQLGNNTTTNSSTPIKIMDGVKSVALGNFFSVILKKDGTVYTCGANADGQLGRGSIGNSSSMPKQIDVPSASAVRAGGSHAAVITDSGDLLLWGYNGYGQVGNKTTVDESEPTIIMRGVKQVSLGDYHTLAMKNDGTLWSWGNGYQGRLGDHQDTDYYSRLSPHEIFLENKDVSFQTNNEKTLDVIWDDNYFNYDSSSYNKDLAVDGIILSEAAYSNGNVLKQFGFTEISRQMSNNSVDKPGYLIGYKVMYDFGETRVDIVMAIRGTKSVLSADAITDIKSVGDGFNSATEYCYTALKSARTTIARNLDGMGLSMSKKNTNYFIVGHSLGGACAGKLALRMANDGVAYTDNIYCYTYAAPNYTNIEASMDSVVNVSGIFNIVNIDDIVPCVPKMMWYVYPLWGTSLYKAGKTYKFTTANNTSSFNSIIYDLYGEIPWDTYTPYKSHMTSTYYALLNSSDYAVAESYANQRTRVVSVHCPVDVEVYDKNGEMCGYSRGETVTYPNISAVRITVVDDEKFIELPDESYTVKYIGTDTGSMRVEDQVINVGTGEVESEKVFEDVVLEEGKQFESAIDAEDTDKTDLYVVDSDGDKISSVDVNGDETTLYSYDITEHNIQISTDSYKYDGTAKTQTVSVEGLTEGTDYRVIYDNNVGVGTATVTVKGINDYYGRESKTFKIYDEGTCSETVSWKLSPSGALTITGNGEIPNYDSENPAPWSANASSISKIVINDGVTAIGNNAFAGCEEATEIYIPSSVTTIGDNATDGCANLTSINYTGTSNEWNAITVGEGNTVVESTEKTYSSTESGHIWDNGVITKTATCSAEGEMTYTCTECSITKTEPIAKIAHSYETKTTNPTCTAKGYTTYTCTNCGDTYVSDYVNAQGHTAVIDKEVPATFKATGKTAGSHCSVCGAVITAQKTVAKLGAAKLSKVTTGKKQFKATWKKVVGVDGYQVQYSTDKNFKKGNKTVTIKKQATTSTTVKKLKAKKKYYVRIRAYKTINGKKQYSAWSAKKAVTTKK